MTVKPLLTAQDIREAQKAAHAKRLASDRPFTTQEWSQLEADFLNSRLQAIGKRK
jgi:hypothetical protein